MPKFFRKVIRIRATDSPNVRRGLEMTARGMVPDDRELVPGVLTWGQYQHRLKTWDIVRQTVGLGAEFYLGAQVLLFPPERLDAAEARARALRGQRRRAKAVGIDPAEGGDKTALAAVDEFGLIELLALQTPDTDKIPGLVTAFGRRHGAPPDAWVFDHGGGGKEHADRLRGQGLPVRVVGFGESVKLPVKRAGVVRGFAERQEVTEDRVTYLNRRVQMYYELALLLDEHSSLAGGRLFALPPGEDGPQYEALRKQLAVFPREEDGEGRATLPPKNKRNKDDKRRTLTEMIGHSPDEADAVCLACFGMLHPVRKMLAGVS